MKLTNPTDDELNAAFAEKVAGWHGLKMGVYGPGAPERKPTMHGTPPTRKEGKFPIPQFTRSADAVLPWLEKNDAIVTRSTKENDWRVVVAGGRCNSASSFPRAAVIALLRAHGVEVEFTE